MLDLLEIKDWLKTKTDVGDGIAVGAIKGEKLRYIGVYDGKTAARQRVCLGGPGQTGYQERTISILVHWTKNPSQAAAKAAEIHGLFCGLSKEPMKDHCIVMADPGGQPLSVGPDATGVYEYVINAKITYERMR